MTIGVCTYVYIRGVLTEGDPWGPLRAIMAGYKQVISVPKGIFDEGSFERLPYLRWLPCLYSL